MKEGRQIGGEQEIRVKEELLRRAGRREMKEGAGRGSAWTEVGSEGGREGREGEK